MRLGICALRIIFRPVRHLLVVPTNLRVEDFPIVIYEHGFILFAKDKFAFSLVSLGERASIAAKQPPSSSIPNRHGLPLQQIRLSLSRQIQDYFQRRIRDNAQYGREC